MITMNQHPRDWVMQLGISRQLSEQETNDVTGIQLVNQHESKHCEVTFEEGMSQRFTWSEGEWERDEGRIAKSDQQRFDDAAKRGYRNGD